jgi:hypothetical protein
LDKPPVEFFLRWGENYFSRLNCLWWQFNDWFPVDACVYMQKILKFIIDRTAQWMKNRGKTAGIERAY